MSNTITPLEQNNEITKETFQDGQPSGVKFRNYVLEILKNKPTAKALVEENNKQKLTMELASSKVNAATILPIIYDKIDKVEVDIRQAEQDICDIRNILAKLPKSATSEERMVLYAQIGSLNNQKNKFNELLLKLLDKVNFSESIKSKNIQIKIDNLDNSRNNSYHFKQKNPPLGNIVEVSESSDSAEQIINLTTDIEDLI